jgi:uncharacterized protein YjbI with pentapeptide repeats
MEIKHRYTGAVLYSDDSADLKTCVMRAVGTRANLADANLAGANLAGANLAGANLAGAYLARAKLGGTYLFSIAGTRRYVLAARNGNIKIGCQVHTAIKWRKKGLGLAKENGYSDAQIAEYRQYVNVAAAWIRASKKIPMGKSK